MAVKFTNPKKWDDVWFSKLNMEQRVMFLYLCDMCDIAGFLEINERLIEFHTGIKDVDETINSLSKSVVYKDGYIWIKKYIKHQMNTPINTLNNAHKGIIKSIIDRKSFINDIKENLSSKDFDTIVKYLGENRGYEGASEPLVSPTSKGNSNSIDKEVEEEGNVSRLYKYFVGEENLMGGGITPATKKILVGAIKVMDPDKWKVYCDLRLNDTFKSSPYKFFLEEGWRRYQDQVKEKQNEIKRTESIKSTIKEIKEKPVEEVPDEFKEFVKNFGKRKTKSKAAINTSS